MKSRARWVRISLSAEKYSACHESNDDEICMVNYRVEKEVSLHHWYNITCLGRKWISGANIDNHITHRQL